MGKLPAGNKLQQILGSALLPQGLQFCCGTVASSLWLSSHTDRYRREPHPSCTHLWTRAFVLQPWRLYRCSSGQVNTTASRTVLSLVVLTTLSLGPAQVMSVLRAVICSSPLLYVCSWRTSCFVPSIGRIKVGINQRGTRPLQSKARQRCPAPSPSALGGRSRLPQPDTLGHKTLRPWW